MQRLSVLLVLVLICIQHRGSSAWKNKLARSNVKDDNRVITVHVMQEQVRGFTSRAARLGCYYEVESLEASPVAVTWLVGDGPRHASPIFECADFTYARESCRHPTTLDPGYEGRVRLGNYSADLIISDVREGDNRVYWCQVSLNGEEDSSNELVFDMASVALQILDSDDAIPKLHSVVVSEQPVQALAGSQLTLECTCSGSHCDDVHWYKGPVSREGSTEYERVYTRMARTRPQPTLYEAHGRWINRTHLSGNSLKMSGLKLTDAGRYWCEARAADFYQIGEYATDARSVVVRVTDQVTDPHTDTDTDTDKGAKKFTCVGKSDGLYGDVGDCESYFECSADRAYHRSCPPGTVFNPTGGPWQACDHPYNVAPPCGNLGQ